MYISGVVVNLKNSKQIVSRMNFTDISPSLSDKSLEVLGELGFTHSTPVQAATIPQFLSHKDCLVEVIKRRAHHNCTNFTRKMNGSVHF